MTSQSSSESRDDNLNGNVNNGSAVNQFCLAIGSHFKGSFHMKFLVVLKAYLTSLICS
jgi:hypothetical protein